MAPQLCRYHRDCRMFLDICFTGDERGVGADATKNPGPRSPCSVALPGRRFRRLSEEQLSGARAVVGHGSLMQQIFVEGMTSRPAATPSFGGLSLEPGETLGAYNMQEYYTCPCVCAAVLHEEAASAWNTCSASPAAAPAVKNTRSSGDRIAPRRRRRRTASRRRRGTLTCRTKKALNALGRVMLDLPFWGDEDAGLPAWHFARLLQRKSAERKRSARRGCSSAAGRGSRITL